MRKCSLFFLIIFLPIKNFGFDLSVSSTPEEIIVDMDEDNKLDFVVSQKDDVLYTFFYEKNIFKLVAQKRVENRFFKNEYDQINSKWVLVRSTEVVSLSKISSLKTIKTYKGKGDVKSYFVSTSQESSFLGLPEYNPSHLLYGDMSQEQQDLALRLSEYSCREFKIHEKFSEFQMDKFMRRFYRKARFNQFFDFDDCQNGCDTNSRRLVCPEGRARCPINLEKVIARSIKKRLKCLYKTNKRLAAEMTSLLVANNLKPGGSSECFQGVGTGSNNCTKIKFKCDSQLSSYGRAFGPENADWPSVSIRKVSCDPNGSIITAEKLAGTAFHEMFHLLGYYHRESPEFAYSCTLACDGRRGSRDDYDYEIAKSDAKKVCSEAPFENEIDTEYERLKAIFKYEQNPELLYTYIGTRPNPLLFSDRAKVKSIVFDYFEHSKNFVNNSGCNSVDYYSTDDPNYTNCFKRFIRGGLDSNISLKSMNKRPPYDPNDFGYAEFMTQLLLYTPSDVDLLSEVDDAGPIKVSSIATSTFGTDIDEYNDYKKMADNNEYISLLRVIKAKGKRSGREPIRTFRELTKRNICRLLLSKNTKALPSDIIATCKKVPN